MTALRAWESADVSLIPTESSNQGTHHRFFKSILSENVRQQARSEGVGRMSPMVLGTHLEEPCLEKVTPVVFEMETSSKASTGQESPATFRTLEDSSSAIRGAAVRQVGFVALLGA